MVEVGTGDKSSRFLKESWPITEGLTAGTTKLDGRVTKLIPEGSNVRESERELI